MLFKEIFFIFGDQYYLLRMQGEYEIPSWLTKPDFFPSKEGLEKLTVSQFQPLQCHVLTNEHIPLIIGYVNSLIYHLRSSSSPQLDPASSQLQSQLLQRLYKMRSKNPERLFSVENYGNVPALAEFLKKILLLSEKLFSDPSQFCFQIMNCQLQILLLCREVDKIVSLDILKKLASPEITKNWYELIKRLDKIAHSFFSYLRENQYHTTLINELSYRFSDDLQISLFMECFKMQYEILYDGMGNQRGRLSLSQVKTMAEKWKTLAENINKIVERRSEQALGKTLIRILRENGIVEKIYAMIESCCDDYSFIENEENCYKIYWCFEILTVWHKLKLDSNSWHFYRAFRLISSILQTKKQKVPNMFQEIRSRTQSLLKDTDILKNSNRHMIEESDLRTIRITLKDSQQLLSCCVARILENSEASTKLLYKQITDTRKSIKLKLCKCIQNFKEIRSTKNLSKYENSEVFYSSIIESLEKTEINQRKVDAIWADRQLLEYIYSQELKYFKFLNHGFTITEIKVFMGTQWPIDENQKIQWKKVFAKLSESITLTKNPSFEIKWKNLLLRAFIRDEKLNEDLVAEKKKFTFADTLVPAKKKQIQCLTIPLNIQIMELKENLKEEGFYELERILKLFLGRKFFQGWCQFINANKVHDDFEHQINKNSEFYEEDFSLLLGLKELYERHGSYVKSKIATMIIHPTLPYLKISTEQAARNSIMKEKPVLREFTDGQFSELIQILNALIMPEIMKGSSEIKIFNSESPEKKRKISTHDQNLSRFISLEQMQNKGEENNEFCYTINLVKVPEYNLKEKYRQLLVGMEKVKNSKCLQDHIKILDIQIDKSTTKLYIFFEEITIKEAHPLKKIMKRAIKQFNKFRQEFQDTFPHWQSLFTINTFSVKILEAMDDPSNEKGFGLYINPFEPFFISMLLPKKLIECDYLSNKNPKFPFIDFAQMILRQAKPSWYFTECIKEEFNHMIEELRALEMELEEDDKVKEFLNCPFFWNSYRKIVEVANFKENYQSQINYEESRRKTNERNKAWLDNRISELEKDLKVKKNDKKVYEELMKARKKLQEFEYLKQKNKDIRERNEEKQNEEENEFMILKQKNLSFGEEPDIDSISYRYAKSFNRATQIYYSIQGIMEKAAYEQNIGNFEKDKHDDNNCGFGMYKWLEGKDQIKKIIEYIAQKERKKGSARANLYEMTYSSFQNHIRWMRNICVHSIRDVSNIMELSHEEKIKIIEKNYPKLFIFLFKYRHIIGKPLTAEVRENKNIDIKYQVTKVLSSIFRENMNNKRQIDKIKKLKELKKYDVHPYEYFEYEIEEDEGYTEKCKCCGILAKSLSKNGNFWDFLNDIKQGDFNVMFFEHHVQQGAKPCQWANKDLTLLLFFNCIKRDQLTAEELALVYDKPALQAVQNEHSLNRKLIETKGPKRNKIEPQIRERLKEKLFKTDYIPQIFLHELLYEFPTLLEDLRNTRYLWDERIYFQRMPEKN